MLNSSVEIMPNRPGGVVATTERQLARADAPYSRLLEAVPDAMVVVNEAGAIVLLNTRAAEQFGYSRAELLGQKVTTIIPKGFVDRLIADGLRTSGAALAGQIGSGIELRGRRKDDSEFPIEVMLSRLDTAEGVLMTAAIRDTTMRKTAELRLVQTEAKYRGLLEAAPDAMVVVNQGGEIVLLNIRTEEQFGYLRDELLGENVTTIIPEGFSERLIADGLRSASEALAQHIGTGIELNGRRKDGSDFPIEIMLSPLESAEGILVTAAIRDITNRKDAERRAREFVQARQVADQANQAKSRFLAGITHELRTPLHGILGYAEMLMLEGGLNTTQTQRLKAMMAAGQYLVCTINAVLDMSQIEADQLELQPAVIDLPDLVRACLDVVRPGADAKGLALLLAPAESYRLVADPTRLQQVLINLLGNAVKFTPTGVVEVRQQKAEVGEYVRIEVADTGPGVWLRHRDKLFRTFERLNADMVSGIEGAGLGLAIAARLVQLMDGRIGYVDNPGGGSVFWLELPLSSAPSAAVDAGRGASLAEGPHLRVLVVDDEALNRNIASGFLTLAGHEVVCAENGAAAVEAAAGEDFDVILMDVRMPGMDGLEATRRIRLLPDPRGKVRVVAVTAQAFAQQIEICQRAGMDGHVSKPFKQAVLLAALESEAIAPISKGLVAIPLAAACADAGPELPVFDRAVFETIAELLGEAGLKENLLILITHADALLRGLQGAEMLSEAHGLAEAAHKLAGGSGTFGFLAVAAAAGRFELAVDANTSCSSAAEVVAHGHALAAAITALLAVVREELAGIAG